MFRIGATEQLTLPYGSISTFVTQHELLSSPVNLSVLSSVINTHHASASYALSSPSSFPPFTLSSRSSLSSAQPSSSSPSSSSSYGSACPRSFPSFVIYPHFAIFYTQPPFSISKSDTRLAAVISQ